MKKPCGVGVGKVETGVKDESPGVYRMGGGRVGR